jgi:beta-N-acetylhexosaminidase
MRLMREHDTIGRVFMVGIPGPTIDTATRAQLQDLQPGGIILFRRNYTTPEALAALCEDVRTLLPTHPPLIALDHEGGRVHRLSPPFTHFPPGSVVGKTDSPELARRVGYAMGIELSSIGIDIDFAPVLDVLTNPANTVIGDRAFAADPQKVGILGCAQARGLREGGVIPCGKHFPGHGATQIDSHDDLPRDERQWNELWQTDLHPFRMAITDGIEILMVAHIVYPSLDPNHPATLSSRIIEGLLRQQMNYQGVVVTDDLEMGAIVRHDTVEQAAVQALGAGADLLLICHSLDRALAARAACLQALADENLSPQRVHKSVERLTALTQKHALQQRAGKEVIGSLAHQELAATIAQQASERA